MHIYMNEMKIWSKQFRVLFVNDRQLFWNKRFLHFL